MFPFKQIIIFKSYNSINFTFIQNVLDNYHIHYKSDYTNNEYTITIYAKDFQRVTTYLNEYELTWIQNNKL